MKGTHCLPATSIWYCMVPFTALSTATIPPFCSSSLLKKKGLVKQRNCVSRFPTISHKAHKRGQRFSPFLLFFSPLPSSPFLSPLLLSSSFSSLSLVSRGKCDYGHVFNYQRNAGYFRLGNDGLEQLHFLFIQLMHEILERNRGCIHPLLSTSADPLLGASHSSPYLFLSLSHTF